MKKWMFMITILTTILLLAACGNETENTQGDQGNNDKTSESESASLQLLDDAEIGKYLADAEGMTLYYFTKDESGKSNCSGKCLDNWPPFIAKDFEVPEGFSKNDFATIEREDTGEKQVTYKGYPLYYFVKDQAKGDVKGQGVKDVWYIVNAKTTF
ncbi:COG4315 family predicted lipoprotein [Virgibacillus necropolis]|uniref:Lipoprotein n=1 Tax=Virgibacillus necropolis TaxID=163877 RepID=A0A221MH35_9BACI|nr:hypothetical protein [Virgibacillus necropolis]ASN06941.1 hypothetical protein CFK40_18945 [Virgibacillus necropolis]